jgi:hypothetical protein
MGSAALIDLGLVLALEAVARSMKRRKAPRIMTVVHPWAVRRADEERGKRNFCLRRYGNSAMREILV